MPNIMSTREAHDRYCTRPIRQGQYGDVRRCEHGHIMLAYEVLGTVAPYWRTLHPIWTPISFWLARRALAVTTPLMTIHKPGLPCGVDQGMTATGPSVNCRGCLGALDLQDTRSDEL